MMATGTNLPLVGRCRTKVCRGKQPLTEEQAFRKTLTLRCAKHKVSAYLCTCGSYHVGHVRSYGVPRSWWCPGCAAEKAISKAKEQR